MRFHVVEEEVLLLVGPPCLLVSSQDGLHRAVVDAKALGDRALAKVMHLAVVDYVQSVTVTDHLVDRVRLNGVA